MNAQQFITVTEPQETSIGSVTFTNSSTTGGFPMSEVTNPSPDAAFQALFAGIGLQIDARFKTELASLTGIHEADFVAMAENISKLMTATDGDDTETGFQILTTLRSDLNGVIAKANGNSAALTALQATVAQLDTALRAYIDTKISDLQAQVNANAEKSTNNATAIQTETQRALLKENALETRIANSETAVGTLNQGLQAEVLTRQTEKGEVDTSIADNRAYAEGLSASKLDASWAANLIGSVDSLKSAFATGLAGQTI